MFQAVRIMFFLIFYCWAPIRNQILKEQGINVWRHLAFTISRTVVFLHEEWFDYSWYHVLLDASGEATVSHRKADCEGCSSATKSRVLYWSATHVKTNEATSDTMQPTARYIGTAAVAKYAKALV